MTPGTTFGSINMVNWDIIDQTLDKGRVIEALKDYREQTGAGLKEAMVTFAGRLQTQKRPIPDVLQRYAQWPALTEEQARKIAQEIFGRSVVNVQLTDDGYAVALQGHKLMGHMLPYSAQITRVEGNAVVRLTVPLE